MRIAVIGAGAIGGVTAAYLTMGGYDVTLVCHRRETAEKVRDPGLHITGTRGEQYIQMNAVDSIEALAGKFDAVLVATKAYDAADAARRALPFLAEKGIVLSLQNGIGIDELTEAVGAPHAACGVVSWSCTMVEDGWMDLTGEGGFVIGMAAGGCDIRLSALAQALEAMAPTRVTDDILSEMYSKLIINSGITCGGALMGLRLGPMLLRPRVRRFFIAIVREDMAVARAMGLAVPPFGGRLDYEKFDAGDGCLDHLRRHLTLLAVGVKYRRLKSSSLTSLERGGKTEVDYLNGWISRKARLLGVFTPVNDGVVDIIREIEAGRREISPANLADIID